MGRVKYTNAVSDIIIALAKDGFTVRFVDKKGCPITVNGYPMRGYLYKSNPRLGKGEYCTNLAHFFLDNVSKIKVNLGRKSAVIVIRDVRKLVSVMQYPPPERRET